MSTRRQFLIAAASAAVAAAAPSATRVRFGGPIFLKSTDPRELAIEHRRLGYSAAYCPGDANVNDRAHIAAIRDAFTKENVVIAEVGAWKNMLDPDDAVRKAALDYVTERMALADEVGARCCVDIAGSYNPKVWYGPHRDNLSKKFFDATVANARHIIDSTKPKRSTFTIEMMGWNLPDNPDNYLRLIKAVDRPAFGVHVDVCNMINSPEKFYNSGAVIEDCFRKLGKWIKSCHAKDLAWPAELNVHFVEVIPGRGEVDYKAYLRELAKLPQDAPLMMEHLKTAEEYDEGKRYIQSVAKSIGVEFA
ncbi:MAG TPA: sugar phosphate isomerase/epimerase [Bryobacteraceae bacterium]|jgi:sugar phosphate isomerase/epimerase